MEFTVHQLSAMVGGTTEGREDVVIRGFGKIEDAREGDLTFLANPRYTHYLYTTKASAAIVSEDFIPEKSLDCVLIRVKDPYTTLAELMTKLEQSRPVPVGIEQPVSIAEDAQIGEGCYVGAFSYISPGCRIGRNVKIYPQVYLGANVIVGDDTVIRSGVKVYEDCKVGARCILHAGAVIGADGFGFAPDATGRYHKIPQTGNVEIGDDVEIGANTCIDRSTFGSTQIGNGTKLDNLIQVGHNVELGENNVISAQAGIAGSTKIGNGNRIGGQTGFSGHIAIGDHNEIGAQSGVHSNIGNGKRMLGYPAIEARQFAKNLVYINKLEELFRNRK